ncbi:hypothetical protein CcaverHIS002_0704490 [Cutaneotrichosporon cavernicola]|nr:hypothetical protein CcaverHIS002_0704490 [Cutaneotrichosporon cavernicola]
MAHKVLPYPTEEQAKALFSPRQRSDSHFTRICVFGTTATTLGVTAYSGWLVSHRFVVNFGHYQPFFEATPGLASTLAVKIIFASLASARDSANVYIPTAIWLASTMVTDLIITGAILFGLLKSRTGWTNTNRMITRLIRITLEAQIPATMSAVIYLGAFLTRKSTAVTIAIVYFQSKLYAVGFLYSLNARQLLSTIGRQDLADASSCADFQSPRPSTFQFTSPTETREEMKQV